MTTELTEREYTAKDIAHYFVDDEDFDVTESGYDLVTFKTDPKYKNKYDWLKEDWCDSSTWALKDEDGNPIIHDVRHVNPDDDDFDEDFYYENRGEFQYEGGYVPGIGWFNSVTSGNLGDGHEAWAIFKHKETGRLFRLGGWYSSWDTGEMNEFVEVEEAPVTVVRYKDKDSGVVFDNPVL